MNPIVAVPSGFKRFELILTSELTALYVSLKVPLSYVLICTLAPKDT